MQHMTQTLGAVASQTNILVFISKICVSPCVCTDLKNVLIYIASNQHYTKKKIVTYDDSKKNYTNECQDKTSSYSLN